MTFTQVAAMASNRVIGRDNKLPWNIPEDLKFFKKVTAGKILIMGRKTFESLPGHLPGRYHIVVSRNDFISDEEDVTFVQSIDAAVDVARELVPDYSPEVCIVGGAEIYRQTLELTHKIYLTVIDQAYEGDTYFPEFSEADFRLTAREDRPGNPSYSFRTYVRERK